MEEVYLPPDYTKSIQVQIATPSPSFIIEDNDKKKFICMEMKNDYTNIEKTAKFILDYLYIYNNGAEPDPPANNFVYRDLKSLLGGCARMTKIVQEIYVEGEIDIQLFNEIYLLAYQFGLEKLQKKIAAIIALEIKDMPLDKIAVKLAII